jgi:hypothetical protein
VRPRGRSTGLVAGGRRERQPRRATAPQEPPCVSYEWVKALAVIRRFVAGRTFRKQRLTSMLKWAVPVLPYLERLIRPHWQTPFEMTKRVLGGAIRLVDTLLFAPIPLSSVPPAVVIILLSFAYLEAYHSALHSPPHASCS